MGNVFLLYIPPGNHEAMVHYEDTIKNGVSLRQISKFIPPALRDSLRKVFGADVVTLHASIAPPSQPGIAGTEVRLVVLSDDDVRIAKEYFLRFSGDEPLEGTKHGQILKRVPGRPAGTYANGLTVAEEAHLRF
jgi:hypothetical protein